MAVFRVRDIASVAELTARAHTYARPRTRGPTMTTTLKQVWNGVVAARALAAAAAAAAAGTGRVLMIGPTCETDGRAVSWLS